MKKKSCTSVMLIVFKDTNINILNIQSEFTSFNLSKLLVMRKKVFVLI